MVIAPQLAHCLTQSDVLGAIVVSFKNITVKRLYAFVYRHFIHLRMVILKWNDYIPEQKCFKECQKGAAALEFALVAPIFLLIVFATIEFSLLMFAKSTMEGASNVTARLGKTGFTDALIGRENMLKQLLVTQSSGIFDAAKIQITYKIYRSFSDIAQPEPFTDQNHNGSKDSGEPFQDINGNGTWDSDMGQAGLGGPGDVVVYQVHYPWHLLFPGLSELLGDAHGDYPLNATIVVRNEPFNQS